MVMEIKPLPGQPGMLRDLRTNGELEATSWTSTFAGPMYSAPFGNRNRRSGLGAIALPSSYVAQSRPDAVTQSDIAKDQVPGVAFTAYIPVIQDAVVPQPTLDSVFRTAFAQLGFDVSGSSLDLDQIAYSWKLDPGKGWEATVVAGPKEFVKRTAIIGYTTGSTPIPKDLENLPSQVITYKLLLRPKDLTLTTEKIDALLSAARVAARGNSWGNVLFSLDIKGVAPPVEPEKSLLSSIAPWIALIGVGWIATLAARGKVST